MKCHRYQINSLRQQNMQAIQESTLVVVTIILAIMFLPSIIYRYFYANQNLLEEPLSMQLVPVIGFGLALLQVMATMVTNFQRNRKINALEKEAELELGGCQHAEAEEIRSLEKLIDESLAESKTKSTPAKKSTKKSKAKSKKSK